MLRTPLRRRFSDEETQVWGQEPGAKPNTWTVQENTFELLKMKSHSGALQV